MAMRDGAARSGVTATDTEGPYYTLNPGQEVYPLRLETHNGELERSPWAYKNLLCLDGGGVRGYSSLLILHALMQQVQAFEPDTGWITADMMNRHSLNARDIAGVDASAGSSDYPWKGPLVIADPAFYPAHYFDYISGTSTGGLSAIMLGRLNMSVQQALDQYQDFGNAVFGHPRIFHMTSLLWNPRREKYSTRRKWKAILRVVRLGLRAGDNVGLAKATMFGMTSRHTKRCQTMVVSRVATSGGVYHECLHRSYAQATPGHYPLQDASQHSICDVAMATSAAPKYWGHHTIGDDDHHDGGIGYNNPALLTVTDIAQRHGRRPRLVVNIGTGEKTEGRSVIPKKKQLEEMRSSTSRPQRLRKMLELMRNMPDMLTNRTEVVKHLFLNATSNKWGYLRLEVPNTIQEDGHCLGEVPLDEWQPSQSGHHTLNKIRRLTQRYLAQPDIQEWLRKYAQKLVLIRRQRARTERWEKYVLDVSYRCSASATCNEALELKSRATMRRHLEESHGDMFEGRSREEVENTLNGCRDRLHAAATDDGSPYFRRQASTPLDL